LASSLSPEQLFRLARHGALARISELRAEITAIQQAFPDARGPRRERQPNISPVVSSANDSQVSTSGAQPSSSKSGRRGWTAAQRKAAGQRMKAFWAKRKAERSRDR
jgi:hypothetical protein